jgi:hypothetical protein
MIFAWKDINAFRGHQEEMKNFRLLHDEKKTAELFESDDHLTPEPGYSRAASAAALSDGHDGLALVHIWKTVLARGSQN